MVSLDWTTLVSQQNPLTSLQLGLALRQRLRQGYDRNDLTKDAIAGLTVGVVAIPISMALAIAAGVAPQYGLYTAAISGLIMALSGGSRFTISGPTAAFVVILLPIVQQFGAAGLLLATMMAGAILCVMAFARLGRLVEYIPQGVIQGFSSGLALVIVTLQIKDFFGFAIDQQMPAFYFDKVVLLASHLNTIHLPTAALGLFSLGIIYLWPHLNRVIPPHLAAVFFASIVGWWMNQNGWDIATINSRFFYRLDDGTVGSGIPPVLPSFEWPWKVAGADLAPDWQTLRTLLPAAFAIAMLGAIEPLMCAVLLDRITNTRHSANSELLGQGLGNLIGPLFGAMTGAGAISRSLVNVSAGATSPLSAVFAAVAVIASLWLLAPLFGYLPMAALAALLVHIGLTLLAPKKLWAMLRHSPRADTYVLMLCFALTIVFDLIIGITAGVLLAAILLMKDMANQTALVEIAEDQRVKDKVAGYAVFKVKGPLFFAAADRVFDQVASLLEQPRGVILHMDGVPLLDAGGLAALERLLSFADANQYQLLIADWQAQPLQALEKSGMPVNLRRHFYPTLQSAIDAVRH